MLVVGPVLGGIFLTLASEPTTLVVNSLLFVAALAALLPVTFASNRDDAARPVESFAPEFRAGVRAILSFPDVAGPILLLSAVNLVYGRGIGRRCWSSREELLDGDAGTYGVLNAATASAQVRRPSA